MGVTGFVARCGASLLIELNECEFRDGGSYTYAVCTSDGEYIGCCYLYSLGTCTPLYEAVLDYHGRERDAQGAASRALVAFVDSHGVPGRVRGDEQGLAAGRAPDVVFEPARASAFPGAPITRKARCPARPRVGTGEAPCRERRRGSD